MSEPSSLDCNRLPVGVRSVIAYGSFARGDSDSNSDADICVVYDGSQEFDDLLMNLRQIWPPTVNDGAILDISLYALAEFRSMIRSGSLFGWHMFLEGRALYGREHWLAIFDGISPYSRSIDDLRDYLEIWTDIKSSIDAHGGNVYDLSLLFTIARNTAMVLCAVAESPTFGRMSVFHKAEALYEARFSFEPLVYRDLVAWKLWYTRGGPSRPRTPSGEELKAWLRHVEQMLEFALEVARGDFNN